MHYTHVFSMLKNEDSPKPPFINDKDSYRKAIKWAPIFQDCLSRTYGSVGPLVYVLRAASTVPTETDDPIQSDLVMDTVNAYHGKSSSLYDCPSPTFLGHLQVR